MPFRPATPDRLLLRFCRSGDPAALGELFDRTAAELLRVAVWLCGNRTDAEDLLQRTFVSVIESRERYDPRRRALPWLCGILGNHARKLQELRARRLPAGGEPSGERDPAAVAADAELQAAVAQLQGELSAPYREVLDLHFGEGLNAKEIAARLGRPAGTVRTQLVRALELLRKKLPSGFVAAVAPVLLPDAAALAGVKAAVMLAAKQHVAAAATSLGGVAAWSSAGVLMSKKVMVAVPVLTVMLALAAYVGWPGSSAADPPSPDTPAPVAAEPDNRTTLAEAPRATGSDQVVERHADPTALSAPRPRRGLRFVEATTTQPVAGVKVIAPTTLRTIPFAQPALAIADDDGIAILPAGDTHDAVLAWSPNHLPVAIDLRDLAGVRTVPLQAARELLVFCVDEHGAPVADCTVIAPMQLSAPVRSGAAPGFANPSVPGSACAVTDAQGIARFAGLPLLPFRLGACHPSLFPDDEHLNDAVPIDANSERVTLHFTGAYGAVFALPAGMRAAHWQFPRGAIDRSLGNATDNLEAALQRRFPGCGVHVRMQREPPEDPRTEAWATATDGSLWHGAGTLQPISGIDTPTLLQASTAATGWLRIDLLAGPDRIDGMALGLNDSELHRWLVDSGTAIELATGEYSFSVDGLCLGIDDVVIGRVTVAPQPRSNPHVLTIDAGHGVGRVVLHLDTDGGEPVVKGGVMVTAANGDGTVFCTDLPATQRYWLPSGPFHLTVHAEGYDDFARDLEILTGKTVELTVRLQTTPRR